MNSGDLIHSAYSFETSLQSVGSGRRGSAVSLPVSIVRNSPGTTGGYKPVMKLSADLKVRSTYVERR